MTSASQSYENHVQRPIAWNITFLLSAVAVALTAFAAATSRSLQSVSLLVLSLAVVGGVSLVRLYAIRLQDRIIRLEMQLRLTRLGRSEDLQRLARGQLIALRFASDAELPALIERAVVEQLKPDQIKRSVKDWQPDLSRV